MRPGQMSGAFFLLYWEKEGKADFYFKKQILFYLSKVHKKLFENCAKSTKMELLNGLDK